MQLHEVPRFTGSFFPEGHYPMLTPEMPQSGCSTPFHRAVVPSHLALDGKHVGILTVIGTPEKSGQ